MLDVVARIEAAVGGGDADGVEKAGGAEDEAVVVEGVGHENAVGREKGADAVEEGTIVFEVLDHHEGGDEVERSFGVDLENVALDEFDSGMGVGHQVDADQAPVGVAWAEPFEEVALSATDVEQAGWAASELGEEGLFDLLKKAQVGVFEPALVVVFEIGVVVGFALFGREKGENVATRVAGVQIRRGVHDAGRALANGTGHGGTIAQPSGRGNGQCLEKPGVNYKPNGSVV